MAIHLSIYNNLRQHVAQFASLLVTTVRQKFLNYQLRYETKETTRMVGKLYPKQRS